MVALVRIVRFSWFFTFFIYFVVVFLCYFQWPSHDALAVNFDATGAVSYSMGKSTFFYAINAFMVAYNLIFILLNTVVTQLPVELLPISNKDFWLSDKTHAAYVKQIAANWIWSLAAMLNLVFTLWLVMITYANLEQFDMRKPLNTFWFLAPLLYLIIIVWTAFALFRLQYKTILIHENNIK